MLGTEDELPPLQPPDARRVAARTLVLASVSCRALIEKGATKLGAEAEHTRREGLQWLDAVGAAWELEPDETALLSTPVGQLDKESEVNASWRSEGMVVLAWALQCTELPSVHSECDPMDVAEQVGYLAERRKARLEDPVLRDQDEIEAMAETYLALHWRLREFGLRSDPMDFAHYASTCSWGPLRVVDLEILDGDLAIDGVRLDQVEYRRYRQALSITQERHQAFNWLLGFEPVYSNVTTDT